MRRAGRMAQVVEFFHSKPEALISNLSTEKKKKSLDENRVSHVVGMFHLLID
jgi:hypothetical protein